MDELSLTRLRQCVAAWSGSRRARILLAPVALALVAYLVFGGKPWEVEIPDGRRPKLAETVQVWLWWASLANLAVVGVMAWVAPWWARVPRTTPGRVARQRVSTWFWPAVLGAMVVLGWLAWQRMGQSTWHDEANRVKNTTVGRYEIRGDGTAEWRPVRWRDTFFRNAMPNHHLQTILSRACNDVWVTVVGRGAPPLSEGALRFPSYVAGLVGLALVAVLFSALGMPGAGVLAAWFLAVHPWYLRYASEARGYALAMALAPAVLLALLRAVETGRARWWVAFGLAQFALVYSYLTAVWVLLVVNALVPWVVLRWRGVDVPRTLAAWFATCVLAGALFVQWTAPAIPQLIEYFRSDKARGLGWTLDGFWLQNTLAHFLTALPWSYSRQADSERLELLPWAAQHPGLFVLIVFIVVGALAIGLRRFVHRGGFGLLVAAAAVLPPLGGFLQAKLGGAILFEWYLIFTLPLLCGVFAAGLLDLVPRPDLVRGRLAGAGLAVAVLAAYAVWTHPQRAFLVSSSLQPYREAVLLTRPSLDPSHHGQEDILTAAFHSAPLFYDPRIQRFNTVDELRALMEKADAEGKPLYLNIAYPETARIAHPAKTHLLEKSGLFESVAKLPGLSEELEVHVFRYVPGSAQGFDFTALVDEHPQRRFHD